MVCPWAPLGAHLTTCLSNGQWGINYGYLWARGVHWRPMTSERPPDPPEPPYGAPKTNWVFFKYQWEVKCGTNFPTSGPDEFIGLKGLPWAPVNLFHLPPKPPVFFKWKWDINCFTKLIPLEGTEKQQSHQTTKLLNNQTAKTTCNQTNKELYNQMIKYPNDLGGAEKIIWLRGFQICETLDASMSFGKLGGLRGT